MSNWSLKNNFSSIDERIKTDLTQTKTIKHPTSKGNTTENIWNKLFSLYLPKRYSAASAHVCDSKDNFSDQIDIVIYDYQYSPPLFIYENEKVIPIESVYAVFECKQNITKSNIAYAQKKIKSVRQLERTSLAIPHAGGFYPPKELHPIIGGLLTTNNGWKKPLEQILPENLTIDDLQARIDIGCIVNEGYFTIKKDGDYLIETSERSATKFLFELIAKLQNIATVPMMDMRAYAKWINP